MAVLQNLRRRAVSFFNNSPSLLIPPLPLRLVSNLMKLLTAIFAAAIEQALALNFRLSNLSTRSILLDDQTNMHFWIPTKTDPSRPTLVLVHGYGGNSMWQFIKQVRPLSKSFNLYVPDLLFFGKSHTTSTDRSDAFQAKSVGEGLGRLGVERYSVMGISYGGYVAYQMADLYSEQVEKVVIVGSGICYTNDQKAEELAEIGRDVVDILLPDNAEDARRLVKMTMYKHGFLKWVPDFILCETVRVINENHKNEKKELVQYLSSKDADPHLPVLTQETLLVWGDKDGVFPLYLAYQLQRHLGPRSKVEIIKDAGHAVNMDSPKLLNDLIASFVLKQV